MRSLIAALLLLAVSPAVASADPLPTDRPLTSVRVTESLRIAEKFWGASLPDVKVYAAASDHMATSTGTTGVVGAAVIGGRDIWVRAAQLDNTFVWRITMCTSIVHEYGHLLGLGHSDDPRSVMHGEPDRSALVYGCYERFLPKGRGRWWRKVMGRPTWLGR